MPGSAPFTQLIHTVRSQTNTLLERARDEAAEGIAQFSGRAAAWADQAGAAVADLTDEATGTATTASRSAADAAERYAGQAGDRLTRMTSRWADGLGERVLRIGDSLSHRRRSRD
jgi:hypothetical protein